MKEICSSYAIQIAQYYLYGWEAVIHPSLDLPAILILISALGGNEITGVKSMDE